MTSSPLTIYTDGGARGNPGPAACAYLVYQTPPAVLLQGGKFLGVKTNNEAEYAGVLAALEALSGLNLPPQTGVSFYSDSLLMVNQLKGLYKIKEPRLAALASAIRHILHAKYYIPAFIAIPRSQNAAADRLVNHILDQSPR